jgi:hypothetical protein
MAELDNKTPGLVELVPLIDRYGSNVMVVITKVTYDMHAGQIVVPAPDQAPLTFADVPGVSGAAGELAQASDVTDFKPSTDVVVTAPEGPIDSAPVAGRHLDIQIGSLRFGGKVSKPWVFGPVPRARKPRKDYAGTYDKAWLNERFPLVPSDFDPRHNQVAPPKQIAPRYLVGDETMTIRNLYGPDHVLAAGLPRRAVVVSGNVRGRYFTEVAVLDTLTVSSDRPRLSLVWRLAIKPRQKIEEVRNVFVSTASIRSARELYGKP